MQDSIGVVSEVRLTVDDDRHGGRLVLADPCYVDTDDGTSPEEVLASKTYDEWGVILDKCAGEWVGAVDVASDRETQGWGERISILRLTRMNRDVRGLTRSGYYNRQFEYVSSNGVDSGQMYAAGLEHLPVDYEALLSQYYNDGREWVNHLVLSSSGGIVSSTGYGDGLYPVYVARDSDGRPVVVEVRFLEDDHEDEEE